MDRSKQFRESLKNGLDFTKIAQVLKTYSPKEFVPAEGKFNLNHQVKGFHINRNGELFIDIYWQGDSTDGDTCLSANAFKYRDTIVIPAESFFDGYRTRIVHSDLRITRKELEEAKESLIEWLSPEKIKARRLEEKRTKASRKVEIFCNDTVVPALKKMFCSFQNTRLQHYWELLNYIRENSIDLAKLPPEELKEKLIDTYSKL